MWGISPWGVDPWGTQPEADNGDVSVTANLAQWTWTPLQATVATDRTVNANLAQWTWTPLQANVSTNADVTVNANLAAWTWTPNQATVTSESTIAAALAQWQWTPNQATVSVTPQAAEITANLAQWQWTTHRANVEAIDPNAVALGGGRGSKGRSRYPRRVMIDGKLYWVNSYQEEQRLLEAHFKKAREEVKALEELEAPKEQIAKVKVKAVRLERRIEKVEEDKFAHLREEDEEILMYFH